MLVHFLIVILLSVNASADARASCDGLLVAATATVSSNDKSLPPSARAYVNLIKFYIQKSAGELDDRTVQAILNAKSFANPFEGRTDVLSDQLASALRVLKPKVTDQDWLLIQSAITDLIEKTKLESEDRRIVEHGTSYLLETKLIDVDRSRTIGLDTSSYEKDGRVYLATHIGSGRDSKLIIYEFTADGRREIAQLSQGGPVWHAAGERLYLIVQGLNFELYVFEIVGSKVKEVSKERNRMLGRTFVQSINGRLFILTPSSFAQDDIGLYELVDNKLVFIAKPPRLRDKDMSTATFQLIDGKIVLLAGFFVRGRYAHVKMFTLDGNELIYNDSFSLSFLNSSASAWYSFRGRVLLATAGANDKKIHIFELKNKRLVSLSSIDVGFEVERAPLWQERHGRLFLAASTGIFLKVFELSEDQLSLLIETRIESAIFKIMPALPFSSENFQLRLYDGDKIAYNVQILKKQSKDK